MKKVILFIFPILLAVIVFIGLVFFLKITKKEKGALQVTSNPNSDVFLNGKEIGKTPLCKCDPNDMLQTGDYTIKLVPLKAGTQPYEEKIMLSQSVLTVVDRTFGDVGKSSGSVISLQPVTDQKNSQIFVSSIPYGSDVTMDSNPAGVTPLLIDHVTDSDHELKISKTGYSEKTIRVHGVMGYKLDAIISLATDLTPIAIVTATPSAAPSNTPTPTSVLQGPTIVILNTPTGFLRVRDNASLGGNEIAQVHPGESYQFIGVQDGWYQIKLNDGRTGWVSSSYAKKQ